MGAIIPANGYKQAILARCFLFQRKQAEFSTVGIHRDSMENGVWKHESHKEWCGKIRETKGGREIKREEKEQVLPHIKNQITRRTVSKAEEESKWEEKSWVSLLFEKFLWSLKSNGLSQQTMRCELTFSEHSGWGRCGVFRHCYRIHTRRVVIMEWNVLLMPRKCLCNCVSMQSYKFLNDSFCRLQKQIREACYLRMSVLTSQPVIVHINLLCCNIGEIVWGSADEPPKQISVHSIYFADLCKLYAHACY